MSAAPSPPFDPEQYAPRLAPAGAVLAVAGGCVGGWAGLLLAAVGCGLLLTACVSRRDGLLLLGPFVRSELVRAPRTRRLALWRAVYAAATGGMMVLFFLRAMVGTGQVVGDRGLGVLAEGFFLTFSAVQFGYLVYLTLSLVAPIVAEEREAARWDFLLATDLRAREILFGKAVGRLPLVLDPVLASLPVLALSTLFGGVSPRLVVAVGVATVAAVLGTAGVAFFYSVFSPTAKQANERASGLIFAYLLVSGGLCLCRLDPAVWEFPSTFDFQSPVEVGDVVRAVNAGNPFSAVAFVGADASAGRGPYETVFEQAVRKFVAFQAGVFLLFGLIATARLRTATPWGKKGAAATAAEKAAGGKVVPPVGRPPVGELPVYWWERYGSLTRAQLRLVGWLTPRRYLGVGLFAGVGLLAARAGDEHWVYGPGKLYDAVRGGVTFCLWLSAWVMMISPAMRAVRGVAKERSADTLDGLKLTALTPRDILFEKWLGAVMADSPLYLVTLVLAAAGAVTGSVHPVGAVGLLVTVPVFAGAGAAVGLYFSVRAANPSNATRNLVLIGGGGLYVFGSLAGAAVAWLKTPAPMIAAFPPAAAGIGLILGVEGEKFTAYEVAQGLLGVLAGMAVYAGLGWAAWRDTVGRFDRERHD